MSTSDAPLLPCLKEFKWVGGADTVCHPLWEKEASPYMPWVAFGYDHPHTFEFIATKRLTELNTTAQELEAKALAALRARPAKWEPVDVPARDGKTLRILTCSGDFFSAERVLDAAFMQEAQQILKATGLFVGVPRRGLLMATAANQDKELIGGFGGTVAGQFSRGKSALISPMLFAMKDGAIIGIFDAVAKIAVPDGEPRGPLGEESEEDEDAAGDDPNKPFVSAIVTRNDKGSEDVHLLVGGPEPDSLAKAIEAGFQALLKEHAARKEFSGHIEIVILGMTPVSARKHIPKLLEHLKGICNEMSKGNERRYRVSLTYQKDSLPSTPSAPAAAKTSAAAKMPAAAKAPAVVRAPRAPAAKTASTSDRPSWLNAKSVVAVLLGIAAAIYGLNRSPGLPSYASTFAYGGASLTRATNWERSGTAAAVYVPAGETMPDASLQLGIISSTAHDTPDALLSWIQAQSETSFTMHRLLDVVNGRERCLAGIGRERPFLALQLCKPGQAFVACIESDRELDRDTFNTCRKKGCFPDLCERQWLEERQSLDRALTSFLTP